MNKRENDNTLGTLVTVSQMASTSNLGVTTVRKIAEEAGAVRRIGRCYRINREVFLNYVENTYAFN